MMRFPSFPRVAAVLLVLAGLSPDAGAVVVDRIVATVDGAPITLFELERFIRLNGGTDPNAVSEEDRKKALELLIGETLVRLEARQLGLSISKEDVELYIQEIKRGNNLDDAGLAQALAQQGFTLESYRQQIAKDLLKNQLVSRQIREQVQINPSDVQAYYEDNKEMFAKAGAVHLRQIFFVMPPDASAADQQKVAQVAQQAVNELQGGASFAQVAKKYSQGPEAEDGGSLGWMRKGQMIPELEEVAFSLRKGQVAPPLRTAAGVHILMVDDVRAEDYVPLADVENQIKERLYAEAVQERFQDYVEADLMEGHAIVRRLDAPSTRPAAAPAEEPASPDDDEEPSSTGSGDHAG